MSDDDELVIETVEQMRQQHAYWLIVRPRAAGKTRMAQAIEEAIRRTMDPEYREKA